MECNVKNNIDRTCFIEVIKNIMSETQSTILGEDIFYLLKCYRIIYTDWIGYDFESEFRNISYIESISLSVSNINEYLLMEEKYGVLIFANTKALTYNDIYQKNEDRTHCVRVVGVSEDTINIVDNHIRINDEMIISQNATLSIKELDKFYTYIYVIDKTELQKEYNKLTIKEYYEGLFDFFFSEDVGMNTIKKYLKESKASIETINVNELYYKVFQIYYDLKINALLYVNYYIKDVYCKVCKISEQIFNNLYIKDIENKLEKLIYNAIKGSKDSVIEILNDLEKICEKESEEFGFGYNGYKN